MYCRLRGRIVVCVCVYVCMWNGRGVCVYPWKCRMYSQQQIVQ